MADYHTEQNFRMATKMLDQQAEINELRARAERAEVVTDRVRALHSSEYGLCTECTNAVGVHYPCNTVRALDGPAVPEQTGDAGD